MFRNLSDPLTQLFPDGEIKTQFITNQFTAATASDSGTDDFVYVLLRTATVQDSDTMNWRYGAGIRISGGLRTAMGICVSAPESAGNTLYEYNISARIGQFRASLNANIIHRVSLQPFVGQLRTTAPVAWRGNFGSNVTKLNQTDYQMLPCLHKEHQTVSARGRVLVGKNLASVTPTVSVGNPIVFGVIIRADAIQVGSPVDMCVSAMKITEPTEINGEFPSTETITV